MQNILLERDVCSRFWWIFENIPSRRTTYDEGLDWTAHTALYKFTRCSDQTIDYWLLTVRRIGSRWDGTMSNTTGTNNFFFGETRKSWTWLERFFSSQWRLAFGRAEMLHSSKRLETSEKEGKCEKQECGKSRPARNYYMTRLEIKKRKKDDKCWCSTHKSEKLCYGNGFGEIGVIL